MIKVDSFGVSLSTCFLTKKAADFLYRFFQLGDIGMILKLFLDMQRTSMRLLLLSIHPVFDSFRFAPVGNTGK